MLVKVVENHLFQIHFRGDNTNKTKTFDLYILKDHVQ